MTDLQNDLPTTGRFVGRAHRFAVRVYFEDTDFSGVVYHANYLRFMERARSDMLRVAGIDQRDAFATGDGVYAVADLSIRYRRPAHFDDALVIISTVAAVRALVSPVCPPQAPQSRLDPKGLLAVALP